MERASGGADNMRSLGELGGGAQTEKIRKFNYFNNNLINSALKSLLLEKIDFLRYFSLNV